MTVIWILAFAFLGLLAYVRCAPSDPERWHVMPEVSEDRTLSNKAMRRVTLGEDALRRLDVVAQSDPRTDVLAGSAEEGHITYITRSRLMGYPDYTSAAQDGEDLVIFARSRFGRRDHGVNASRVDRWIAALAAY